MSECLSVSEQHVNDKKWLNDGSVVQSYPWLPTELEASLGYITFKTLGGARGTL